jgi:nucleoside phosphorylase
MTMVRIGDGLLPFLAAACTIATAACGGDDDGTRNVEPVKPTAVLTAFPAELSAVLEHAEVTDTQTVDGLKVRIGTINGHPVVMAMTGIGMVNATASTATLLDSFDVEGVVFSGVAGTSFNIGDVIIADTWMIVDDMTTYAVDPAWLELSQSLVGASDVVLDDCVSLPTDPTTNVCLPNAPVVRVGGVGETDDPFGGAFECTEGGNDVYGCDVGGAAAESPGVAFPPDPDPPVASDQETAASIRETQARGLPFIAVRAASDGNGDPLGLPGFPDQFFTYYRLAAHNAAAVAVPFLDRF